MRYKPLPIGIDNFKQLIEQGYYFVDLSDSQQGGTLHLLHQGKRMVSGENETAGYEQAS